MLLYKLYLSSRVSVIFLLKNEHNIHHLGNNKFNFLSIVINFIDEDYTRLICQPNYDEPAIVVGSIHQKVTLVEFSSSELILHANAIRYAIALGI